MKAMHDAETKILGSSLGRDKCVQHAEASILGSSVGRDRCTQLRIMLHILECVTIDGVWIGYWIY
jgi:hypothetical protein